MNSEDQAFFEETLLAMAEQIAAQRDILGVMCLTLLNQNPQAAKELAKAMKKLVPNDSIQMTASMGDLGEFLAGCLEGNLELMFRSFQPRDPHRSSREELRAMLKVLPGGREGP